MEKASDYQNRVFNPSGLALPSTQIRIEVKDDCRYFNPSFENLATSDPADKHQYEDPTYLRNQILTNSNGSGSRRKRNEVYESCTSTSDLSTQRRSYFHRSRHTDTECSEDSTTSTYVNLTRDSCISRFVLFLVLAVSVISLLLVILMMSGILGPSCRCNHKSKGEGTTAKILGHESSPNAESKFETTLSELIRNVSNLQTSLLGSGVVALNAAVKKLHDDKRQVVEILKSTDGYLNRTVKHLREQDSKIYSSLQNKLRAVTMEVKALEQKFYNKSKVSGLEGPRGFNGSQGAKGPQGPTGSGNLSQCLHKESSSSMGSLTMDHIFNPDKDEVIMGATCASSNIFLKVFHQLSYDAPTNRYTCRCVTVDKGYYRCIIHYWSCPKFS